jgi:hypothetical protein
MNVGDAAKYFAWNVICLFMTYYTHALDVLQIIQPSKQWAVKLCLQGSLSFKYNWVIQNLRDQKTFFEL